MSRPYLYQCLLCVIALMSAQVCMGQSYRFQLKKTSSCERQPPSGFGYYLTKASDTTQKTWYRYTDGPVSLPENGIYKIYLEDEIADLPLINIRDTGLYVYQYKQPEIVCYYGLHSTPVYEDCNGWLNGYIEHRNVKGNLELKGTFVDGRVKDSIVTYYTNGAIKRRLIRKPKETFIESFDSLSHRLIVSQNSNKSYLLTDYIRSKYYEDGQIKANEKRRDDVITLTEYSQNKNVKTAQKLNSRIEYFSDGKISKSYTWKAKRERPMRYNKSYNLTVTTKTYDRQGNILSLLIYESWQARRQPDFDRVEEDKDWIIRSVKYQNGKEVFRVEDIDPEEYTAKYPDQ